MFSSLNSAGLSQIKQYSELAVIEENNQTLTNIGESTLTTTTDYLENKH